MTTDPGDLVLDPTCGSGTTAYMAEQWGRRWITTDVSRVGVPMRTTETITIGPKTTTARGVRYLTEADFRRQVDLGLLRVLDEERDKKGGLKKVKVEAFRYVESETKWLERVLGRDIGAKRGLLVMNDEAHHAYRIAREDLGEEEGYEDPEEKEDETERDANRPFPWVVSDFGLTDAIESGLTKIPQLAVRDSSGEDIPGYFNVWQWIIPKLTSGERGGRKGSPKPEAILKYAHHPVAMLGSLWEEKWRELDENTDDPRPPVFIIVCKNTKIAGVVYDWLAEDKRPTGIPPAKLSGFRNTPESVNTIRVDTRVIQETDTEWAKTDEMRWMRFTLDTVGKT